MENDRVDRKTPLGVGFGLPAASRQDSGTLWLRGRRDVRSGAQPIFDLALYDRAEHEHQRAEEKGSPADGGTA